MNNSKEFSLDKANRNKDKDKYATAKMLSLDYRRLAFKMSLMGSDRVVITYNNLFQYFYQRGDSEEISTNDELKKMLELLGDFLLEIRRSMGNENTNLENWDMLEWWMKDIRQMRNVSDK